MLNVDTGGNCACLGTGGIWEISVPQFCCKPNTALIIIIVFLKYIFKNPLVLIYICPTLIPYDELQKHMTCKQVTKSRRQFFYLKKNLFNVDLFLRETKTECEWVRGQGERETQNPKQAPGSELSAQSPTRGLNSRAVRS